MAEANHQVGDIIVDFVIGNKYYFTGNIFDQPKQRNERGEPATGWEGGAKQRSVARFAG